MSSNNSGETVLTGENIQGGIPAEELMEEENILQPGFFLDISMPFVLNRKLSEMHINHTERSAYF